MFENSDPNRKSDFNGRIFETQKPKLCKSGTIGNTHPQWKSQHIVPTSQTFQRNFVIFRHKITDDKNNSKHHTYPINFNR